MRGCVSVCWSWYFKFLINSGKQSCRLAILNFSPVGVRAHRGFAVSNKGRVCLKGCQQLANALPHDSSRYFLFPPARQEINFGTPVSHWALAISCLGRPARPTPRAISPRGRFRCSSAAAFNEIIKSCRNLNCSSKTALPVRFLCAMH